MRAPRHQKLLNLALFMAVLGFILVVFGLLMYWSEDKETYGTCFVSVGGTGIIVSMMMAIFSVSQRRFRSAHIIDDPRITYIYNQQYINYSARASSANIATHSRETSSASNVLSVSDLQFVGNNQDIKVIL